jgi:voltage-gated potassium channel
MEKMTDKGRRLSQFARFRNHVFRLVVVIRGVLGALIALIVLNGFAISWFEKIPIGDAVYFAFVTAFTIGYGDISPETAGGRVVALVIGMFGLIFTGLIVAVATRALADTVKESESESGGSG